jgi:hypothetical protein
MWKCVVMFFFFEGGGGGGNLQAKEALCSIFPSTAIYCSVVDWHRFDTYPDSIFHMDADSDPDPDPPFKFYVC